VEGKN